MEKWERDLERVRVWTDYLKNTPKEQIIEDLAKARFFEPIDHDYLEIGDKLVCDNGNTYTLGEGDGFYTFSLIDENRCIVNYYHDHILYDALDETEPVPLCVGEDEEGKLIFAYVVKYLKGGVEMKKDFLQEYLEEQLKNPEFKKAWEEGEEEFQQLMKQIEELMEERKRSRGEMKVDFYVDEKDSPKYTVTFDEKYLINFIKELCTIHNYYTELYGFEYVDNLRTNLVLFYENLKEKQNEN